MAIQIAEPAKPFGMLMAPAAPPRVCAPRPDGFRLNRKTDEFELTERGQEAAALSQRILLSYVLGYETRAELAHRYGYAERHLQAVISGQTYGWLTAPVRERLFANGIGNLRMTRDARGVRPAQIKRALERLSAAAVEMIRYPQCYSSEEREALATDLYLLSGAWRRDES